MKKINLAEMLEKTMESLLRQKRGPVPVPGTMSPVQEEVRPVPVCSREEDMQEILEKQEELLLILQNQAGAAPERSFPEEMVQERLDKMSERLDQLFAEQEKMNSLLMELTGENTSFIAFS